MIKKGARKMNPKKYLLTLLLGTVWLTGLLAADFPAELGYIFGDIEEVGFESVQRFQADSDVEVFRDHGDFSQAGDGALPLGGRSAPADEMAHWRIDRPAKAFGANGFAHIKRTRDMIHGGRALGGT